MSAFDDVMLIPSHKLLPHAFSYYLLWACLLFYSLSRPFCFRGKGDYLEEVRLSRAAVPLSPLSAYFTCCLWLTGMLAERE